MDHGGDQDSPATVFFVGIETGLDQYLQDFDFPQCRRLGQRRPGEAAAADIGLHPDPE